MNLKIVTTLFKFVWFSTKNLLFFNFEGTFVEGPQCKYKHL